MGPIGKYEILERIGSGGFATVYKGWDPFIKRPVAIKICFSRDEETRQRFFREAEIAGRLVHRNITTIYDFGMQDQNPYLVEEYLPGEDLAHLVRRQEPKQTPVKIDFLLQIASGLEYAHNQGVIHRDIKPSNVRVVESGHLKIMDFGTAKLANVESNLTQSGMTLGTVAYLPPERLLGRPTGLNSDLFSYGVLAYELLSFRRPFSGRNIPHLIDQVLNAAPVRILDVWQECPPRLADLVHRCLLKDPDERYASCSEVIADLQEIATEFTGLSAVRPTESSTSVTVSGNFQAGGLLERAKQLFAQGKLQRAAVIAEEVLEVDPQNVEARQLLEACRQSGPSSGTVQVATGDSTSQNLREGPEERKQRKVNEAIDSIAAYAKAGQLIQAAEALRFALKLFGRLEQQPLLTRRIVMATREQLIQLKADSLRISRGIVDQMVQLRQSGRLHAEIAELFASRVHDLDPDNYAALDLLALVRKESSDQKRQHASDAQDRKKREAVQSIEQLLAQGKARTADDALRFAVRMLGDFEETEELRQRIDQALKESF
jgi:serine/threonine protein kinase